MIDISTANCKPIKVKKNEGLKIKTMFSYRIDNLTI